MKKIFAFILCAATLVFSSVLGISAVSYSESVPDNIGTQILKKGASKSEISEYSGSVVNLADNGSSFCPKADCFVGYEFEADKAGTYTFVIEYIARPGTDRGVDYAIDSTATNKRVLLDLEQSDSKRYAVITEELSAGTHSFYFFCPTGFDDSSLKSCDVYGLSVYFTKEASKANVSDAPDTADTVVICAVALAVSASAAIVVAKKYSN